MNTIQSKRHYAVTKNPHGSQMKISGKLAVGTDVLDDAYAVNIVGGLLVDDIVAKSLTLNSSVTLPGSISVANLTVTGSLTVTGATITGLSHTSLTDIGTNTHDQIDTHIASSHVTSFNARTGVVVPASGDYTWAQINKTVSDISDITTKSHTSLTDIGTNSHGTIDAFISSKAAANGLASLNASTLVVQNPANATSTPTAGKIPIADSFGKLDAWITAASVQTFLIAGEKRASGNNGDGLNSGAWQTRTINYNPVNTISGASVGSNQINLPAGTYLVRGYAVGYKIGLHQVRFRNITDGTTVVTGTNQFSLDSAATETSQSTFVTGFEIAGSKSFELQHRCSVSNSTNGGGRPTSWGDEIYSWVEVTKL